MDEKAEEWLALEDPTEGDLPTTDFIGSAKDLSQTVAPEETDGTGVEALDQPDAPEETDEALDQPDAPEETDGAEIEEATA